MHHTGLHTGKEHPVASKESVHMQTPAISFPVCLSWPQQACYTFLGRPSSSHWLRSDLKHQADVGQASYRIFISDTSQYWLNITQIGSSPLPISVHSTIFLQVPIYISPQYLLPEIPNLRHHHSCILLLSLFLYPCYWEEKYYLALYTQKLSSCDWMENNQTWTKIKISLRGLNI